MTPLNRTHDDFFPAAESDGVIPERRDLVWIRQSICGCTRAAYLAVFFSCWLCGLVVLADDQQLAAGSNVVASGSLVLNNGEKIPGVIQPSGDGQLIRWLGNGFFDPFEFRRRAIRAMHFDADVLHANVAPDPSFVFEMRNGDVVFGDLVSWTPTTMVIHNRIAGTLELTSDRLRWMRRLARADAISLLAGKDQAGPRFRWNGFSDTTVISSTVDGLEIQPWQVQGTSVETELPGSKLIRSGNLPVRLLLDLKLSWSRIPDFVISIAPEQFAGMDTNRISETPEGDEANAVTVGQGRTDGFRLECAGSQLAMIASHGGYVDVQKIADLDGRSMIRLLVYYDLEKGSMEVLSADGETVGRLQLPESVELGPLFKTSTPQPSVENAATVAGNIEVENLAQSLVIEKLELTHWQGGIASRPQVGNVEDLSIFIFQDVGRIEGRVTGLDAAAKTLKIQNATGSDLILPLAKLSEFRGISDGVAAADGSSVIHLADGSVLSGEVTKVDASNWMLATSGAAGELALPLGSVRSIENTRPRDNDVQEMPVLGRIGRIEVGGNVMSGRLVQTQESPDPAAHVLAWHPLQSLVAARIRRDFSGQVQFKDEPVAAQSDAAADLLEQQKLRNQKLRRGLNFGELFLQRTDLSKQASVSRESHLLHFRSGDVLRCRVESASGQSLTISYKLSEKRVIDTRLVKAIEFVSNSPPPNLEAAKKERLLTVPRLQKSEPPSHLLCSHNGDFLRCQFVGMQDDLLTVKVQLNELKIPRERIAQIIWFHPDEIDDSNGMAKSGVTIEEPQAGDRLTINELGSDQRSSDDRELAFKQVNRFEGLVQAVLNDGKRTTFIPTQLMGDWLAGSSRWEGPCEFDIGRVDQILFGDRIQSAVVNIAYNQWRLQSAVEPLVSAVLNADTGDAANRSPLIGQTVPNLSLITLSGEKLKLSEFRGRWLLLDFWTTWSAASVKSLVGLEKIREQLAAYDLSSVSISVGEAPEVVKAFLEKNPMSSEVTLDSEGKFAEELEVTVLPQVVLVSPAGTIESVHFGGGQKMLSMVLKDVLAKLMSPDGSMPPADADAAVE